MVEQIPSSTVGTPAKSPVSSLSSEDPADLNLALQFLKEAHDHLGRSGSGKWKSVQDYYNDQAKVKFPNGSSFTIFIAQACIVCP